MDAAGSDWTVCCGKRLIKHTTCHAGLHMICWKGPCLCQGRLVDDSPVKQNWSCNAGTAYGHRTWVCRVISIQIWGIKPQIDFITLTLSSQYFTEIAFHFTATVLQMMRTLNTSQTKPYRLRLRAKELQLQRQHWTDCVRHQYCHSRITFQTE